jgi:hypothetical protein
LHYPLPDEKLDEAALRVWRTTGWISAAGYAAIVGIVLWLTLRFDWPVWIVIALAVIAAAAAWLEIDVVPKVRMARFRYAIREDEIELLHGIIIRKRTLIPMVKIQHVDTKQGPILRRYGLLAVTFSTAAGNHEIPALDAARAEEVQSRIARLARITDDEL